MNEFELHGIRGRLESEPAEPAELMPDDVGYVYPDPRSKHHTALTCRLDHCSCHLPRPFVPRGLNLTGHEALVLAWRTLDGNAGTPLSFEKISAMLGVMPARVIQIHKKAVRKLQEHARVNYPSRGARTPTAEQLAAAQAYRDAHPDYAAKRALLDAHEKFENGVHNQP